MQRTKRDLTRYDLRIKNKIKNIIAQQKWHEEELYQEQSHSFIKKLDEFKNILHGILDQYLSKGNPNPNPKSRELLGKIFMCIQSIVDVETGREAFAEMQNLILNHSNDSPTLRNYSKKIVKELAFYFSKQQGTLVKREPNLLLTKIKAYNFVDNWIQEKYNVVLDKKETQLKTALTQLDYINNRLENFKKLQLKRKSCIHDRCSDMKALQKHFYNEAVMDEDMDGWYSSSKTSEKVLQKNAARLQKKGYDYYLAAQQEEKLAKQVILDTINQITSSAEINVQDPNIPLRHNDAEINFALYSFIQHLRRDIAQEYTGILETKPYALCQRLAILLEQNQYNEYIDDLLSKIDAQFGISEVKQIPSSEPNPIKIQRQKYQPTHSIKEKFKLFQPYKNQPIQQLPVLTLEEGGAINFINTL